VSFFCGNAVKKPVKTLENLVRTTENCQNCGKLARIMEN